MSPFKARRQAPEPHNCEYREAMVRVGIELNQLQAMHGRNTHVNAAKVLDLMNPRGMWKYMDHPTEPQAAAPDDGGDVDPMTGCKPVTAPPG